MTRPLSSSVTLASLLAAIAFATMLPVQALAGPPGALPVPGAATPTVIPPSAEAQQAARMRRLRGHFSEIQARLGEMKHRLSGYSEQISKGLANTSRVVLIHRNKMGSYFKLRQVRYFLDGKQIYAQDDKTGRLARLTNFEIYNGPLSAKSHGLSVELVYDGDGGFFSYLDGYRFKVKSSFTFYPPRGRITTIAVVGQERGGIGTALEDRPHVVYEVSKKPLLDKKG